MNVDHNEIAKFTAIAERWWDLDGEFKPLHQINPLRVTYIIEQAGGIQDAQTLDIGCGGGILSEALAKCGAIVTGIDLAKALEVGSTVLNQVLKSNMSVICRRHANSNLSSMMWSLVSKCRTRT